MDFLPWKTCHRIVARHGGDHRVRTLTCAEQFRIPAFAQLIYRESLRDIEACLSAQAAKLYHMGIREAVSRSTLADANELRDWRIYAEFAHRLITQVRTRYASEDLGLDLTNTVYALDSTTIAPCLLVFPWAPFRSTKAAIKLHTLLDLRALQEPLAGGVVLKMGETASSYPTFLWHIRECGEVANLDRRFGLCARRHHQEATQPRRLALHFDTDSVGHSVRENAHTTSLAGQSWRGNKHRFQQPTESIRSLTGH